MSTSTIAFIHFGDAETAPQYSGWDKLPEIDRELYLKKFRKDFEAMTLESQLNLNDTDYNDHYMEHAGLCAEFGKVVCISLGKLHTDGKFYIKSFAGKDEKAILVAFAEAITSASVLCAHNGLEFDFPFLFRRFIVNGLPIPAILNTMGKKHWEVALEDTMKLWSATQWNYKCSLALMAHIFGLPSPKQDMDGSMVGELFWSMLTPNEGELPFDAEERVLNKIKTYCNGDIETLVNVYCKLKGLPLIESFIVL